MHHSADDIPEQWPDELRRDGLAGLPERVDAITEELIERVRLDTFGRSMVLQS